MSADNAPIAVVTGGGGGIGREICKTLARRGHAVSAWDISEEGLGQTADELAADGLACHVTTVDVADPDSVAAALASTVDDLGSPAVLVHAAGQIDFCDFEDLDAGRFRRMIDVHVLGAVHVMQAVLPSMTEAGHGRIVNFGSVAAFSGSARHAHYAAAKGAIVAMSKALAKGYGPRGVTINCVAPGAIDTNMFAQVDETALSYYADNPVGRIGRPEDVAAAVAYLVGPDSGFITGSVLHVNGGMYL
ncbi:MAG: tsaC1 [Marmoricola sp.]|nr:tsaC1 [Marmoricola sp.]